VRGEEILTRAISASAAAKYWPWPRLPAIDHREVFLHRVAVTTARWEAPLHHRRPIVLAVSAARSSQRRPCSPPAGTRHIQAPRPSPRAATAR
jgi:hypothetical protein